MGGAARVAIPPSGLGHRSEPGVVAASRARPFRGPSRPSQVAALLEQAPVASPGNARPGWVGRAGDSGQRARLVEGGVGLAVSAAGGLGAALREAEAGCLGRRATPSPGAASGDGGRPARAQFANGRRAVGCVRGVVQPARSGSGFGPKDPERLGGVRLGDE